MTIAQMLVIVCWGVFLLYWFLNWRKVKPTAEKKSRGMIIRILILSVIVIVLFNRFLLGNALHLPACEWSWAGCHFQNFHPTLLQSLPFQVLSVLLALLGLGIAVVARRTLAGNWSSTLDLKVGHELITSGIYHYIRHPIYTGVLTLLVGSLLAFPTIPELVIALVVVSMFLYRIKNEEELLMKTFPKDYPAYKKRTKALIPYIW